MKFYLLLIILLLLCAFALTFFVTGGVEAADYTESEEFKRTIERIESWRPLVTRLWAITDDTYTVDLVLALIAQESMGNQYAIANDRWGSAGLMQVGAQPWMRVTREELLNPTVNIQWGLWFLNRAYWEAEGDWRIMLQIYNCGSERIKSHSGCGAVYAERILEFWYPYFKTMAPIGINWELRFAYRWLCEQKGICYW